MNIVFLDACRTVASGNDVNTNGAAVLPDCALGGFELWADSLLKDSADLLSVQSDALLDRLAVGQTISSATAYVNSCYPAQQEAGLKLELKQKGDGQARLINVYYPNPADINLYKNMWYRVEVLS